MNVLLLSYAFFPLGAVKFMENYSCDLTAINAAIAETDFCVVFFLYKAKLIEF